MELGKRVAAYKGSQARKVLLTLDQWDAIRPQREADEAAEQDAANRPIAAADRWYDSPAESPVRDRPFTTLAPSRFPGGPARPNEIR